MVKSFQYFFAYLSLVILWILIVLVFCSIFNLYGIETNSGIIILSTFFGYIYHKYKPMKFDELFKLIWKK